MSEQYQELTPLLAMTEGAGTSSYYHVDGNGNITALISPNQLVVARRSYEPFGTTLSLSGPKANVNPYWFSSELWDNDTGFAHYPRRVYIPALQRFANCDPIAENGGINLFEFVQNNPVNAVDPFGLWNLWNSATWGVGGNYSLADSLNPFGESASWNGYSAKTFGQSVMAALDGFNPFGDGFADIGWYDPCDEALNRGRNMGKFSWNVLTMAGGYKIAQVFGSAVLGSEAAGLSFSAQAWTGRLTVPAVVASSAEVFGGGVIGTAIVNTSAVSLIAGGASYLTYKLGSMINQFVYGVSGEKPFRNMGLTIGP